MMRLLYCIVLSFTILQVVAAQQTMVKYCLPPQVTFSTTDVTVNIMSPGGLETTYGSTFYAIDATPGKVKYLYSTTETSVMPTETRFISSNTLAFDASDNYAYQYQWSNIDPCSCMKCPDMPTYSFCFSGFLTKPNNENLFLSYNSSNGNDYFQSEFFVVKPIDPSNNIGELLISGETTSDSTSRITMAYESTTTQFLQSVNSSNFDIPETCPPMSKCSSCFAGMQFKGFKSF